MTRYLAAISIFMLNVMLASSGQASETFDWSLWRDLPVQNGGRQKPLETLARETVRTVSNRSGLTDPDTDETLDPVAAYLTMLLDWQGWEHPQRERLLLVNDWRPEYFHLHDADKWDRSPLLRIDFLELRTALGLDPDQTHITPAELAEAKIQDRDLQRSRPFLAWGNELLEAQTSGEELTELETKALELANRYWSYQNHRMGRTMEVIPLRDSDSGEWMPLAHLALTNLNDENDPTGKYRKAQQLFEDLRAAWQAGDSQGFNQAAAEFTAALRHLGTQLDRYPEPLKMDLEVIYNRWVPFRFAWVLTLIALVSMLLHVGSRWKPLYGVAIAAALAALLAAGTGFALRIAIASRPPVTNMYESVVYVGTGALLLGFIFELIYRRKFVLTAAAAVSTVALVLADNCPTVLDPSVRPLEPVLRSNFWLITHVLTITLSYAAFALALGIANITLGYYLWASQPEEKIRELSRFTYKTLQVGVLLLAAGTFLGGVWADYSWGRFWGWDPKEVWALVALLGYLAVLHARYAGWVGHRGLAGLTVLCFSLVVMAWYGVNFVLGAGLHSYGFGGGGQRYVYGALVAQWVYAGIATGCGAERALAADAEAVVNREGSSPWRHGD